MASETEQPPAVSAAADDMVSLEDLVRDSADAGPPMAEAVAAIDSVLAVEDPGFAAEAQALKEAGATPDADVALDSDVEQILAKQKVEQALKGRKKLMLLLVIRPIRKIGKILASVKAIWPWMLLSAFPAMKTGAIAALGGLKKALVWLVGQVKAIVAWFVHQPAFSKLLILAVLVSAIAAGTMMRLVMRGQFLPKLEKDFLTSFADGADETFKFESDDKWQDLNDPFLHPEHIVLIERLIVNLRAPGDGSNPMALLDIYVEGSSKEAAVEIKDRDSAVRDMVLRTMEQMSYDELVTDSGKYKLKVFLRKNLNDMLVTGRVRRLFLKSIVLKP